MDDRRLILLTVDLLASTVHSFVNILFEEEFRPLLNTHRVVLRDTTAKESFYVFLSFAQFMVPKLISDSITNKEISNAYTVAWYKQRFDNFDDVEKELELHASYQKIIDEAGNTAMLPAMMLLKQFSEIPESMIRDDALVKISFKIVSFIHDFVPSVLKNNPIAESLHLTNMIDDVKK